MAGYCTPAPSIHHPQEKHYHPAETSFGLAFLQGCHHINIHKFSLPIIHTVSQTPSLSDEPGQI